MMSKKGYNLQDIMPIALLFVVAIIALSVGDEIVQSIAEDQCVTTAGGHYNFTQGRCVNDSGGFEGNYTTIASNISNMGEQALNEFGSWFGTIALVFAASLVIGVLVYSFSMR